MKDKIDTNMNISKLYSRKNELQEELDKIDRKLKLAQEESLKDYFENNRYFKIENKNGIEVYHLSKNIDEYEIHLCKDYNLIIGKMLILSISDLGIAIETEEETEIGFGKGYAENTCISKEEFKSLIDEYITKIIETSK